MENSLIFSSADDAVVLAGCCLHADVEDHHDGGHKKLK